MTVPRVAKCPSTIALSLLGSLLLASLAGCDKTKRNQALPKGAQGVGDDQLADAAVPSAHQFLFRRDFEKFQPRRAKAEILKEVRYRGAFGMTAEYKGRSVCVIGYQVVFQELAEARVGEGEWIWAVFAADKFEKFVRPPQPKPEDMEIFDVQGSPARRPKPIRVDDLTYFIRFIEGEPVDLAALEKEVRARPAPPEHIDYGLTVAVLLLKATVLRGKLEAGAIDYNRNRELRDQYNASRLSLGMTKAEVEAVLGGKALESGEVQAGSYSIYGSDESFPVERAVRYSNILVVFRDGQARLIIGIDGGEGWRGKLQESYLDFRR